VDAHSGNGKVTVATAVGPVSASSGNGEITVRMARLPAEGDLEFRTGNGRVRVYAPGDLAGDLEARTGNGSFRSDYPVQVVGSFTPHRVRGTIGRGGRRIRMSSGNGDLELLRIAASG
jgi:DUF4097 and DUF4098 domain-containing protein YvlB